MKKFMKLLVVILLLTITASSYAQKFGIKAGLNLSNMLIKDDQDTYSTDFKMSPGFHVGPTAEIPINKMFSFETALLLSTKGYKYSESGYTESANLLYLDLPLTAKASFDIGSIKIYGAFGPYIGMGLSGKFKSTDSPDETLNWGSGSEDDLKRIDLGLTFGAGVEINAIQIGLSYGLGLANISSFTDGGSKINNRVVGISVGYRFGKK